MKTWYIWFVLLFAVCSTEIVQAGPSAHAVASEQGQTISELPVEQKVEQTAKPGFRERIAQRMVQRKIRKAQREGNSDSKTLGLLSLIFGILGWVFAFLLIFLPFAAPLSSLFIIAALVLGILGVKRRSGTGMAIAGLVLSGLPILLGTIVLVVALIILGIG